jgi:cGMP-dependent protein kinase 2
VLRGLTEPVARFYGGGVVLALAYLHGRGVVYRDLKPENVLIAADGYGRLADFGFAKALGPSGRTHTFCGTPGYVAPENVLAAGYGTTADWWGLGVLLYVLLTGRQPFSSPRTDDPMVVMRRIVDAGWRVPFPPYVSRDARALVAALLTRDPGRRLGGGPGGAADVMAHPWFRPLDWDALAARRLPCPRAPRGDAAKRLADLAARAEREKEKEKEREGRSRKGGEGEGDGGSEVDVEALFADF